MTKVTEPIQFSASKRTGGNRILSVPNPLVQIPLHIFVLDNAEILLSKQSEDSDEFMSNSKYYFDSEKIYTNYNLYSDEELIEINENISQDQYKQRILNQYKVSDGKYYSMKIDVSSCYNNIYTHMISWLSGNDNEKIILENFDKIIRNTYNGETKGIPIGPYTSGLFAEMLFSSVDNMLKEKIINGTPISFTRNGDDLEIYSDSKELLDDIKYVVESQLAKLKLEINYNKLVVNEFPLFKLSNYVAEEIQDISKASENAENFNEVVEKMIRMLSNNLVNSISDCKYALIKICSNIKTDNIKIKLTDENAVISYFIDYLINLAFKYNYLVKQCFELIIAVVQKTDIDVRNLANKLINKREARKGHIREIVDIWIVYLITCFGLSNEKIDKYFNEVAYESDLSFIMILNYYNSKVLSNNSKNWIKEYLTHMKDELIEKYDGNWQLGAWTSKYWLLLYMNEKEWKIHEKEGFRDTVLKELTLENICFSNSNFAKRLNLVKILIEKNVTFFEKKEENNLEFLDRLFASVLGN